MPEVREVMKKILLLPPFLAIVLFALGCATSVAPTTSSTLSPTTTVAPTTTVPSTSSTTEAAAPAPATTFTAEHSRRGGDPRGRHHRDRHGHFHHRRHRHSRLLQAHREQHHRGDRVTRPRGRTRNQRVRPTASLSGADTERLSSRRIYHQGKFNSSALIGSLTGGSLAEFAVLLQSGREHVNVGTVGNPKGGIRGQIH